MSYRVISRWLLLVLGFRVPGRDESANRSWLPLVADLGLLSKRYGVHKVQMLLERFYESLMHELRESICMEKPLGMTWMGPKVEWVGGSQGITKVG